MWKLRYPLIHEAVLPNTAVFPMGACVLMRDKPYFVLNGTSQVYISGHQRPADARYPVV